jgi:hypothetical protein
MANAECLLARYHHDEPSALQPINPARVLGRASSDGIDGEAFNGTIACQSLLKVGLDRIQWTPTSKNFTCALRSSIPRSSYRKLRPVANLEHDKRLAQRQLNATLDPVQRLPFEISSEILVLSRSTFPNPGALHTPILLRSVCSAWSSIALAAPEL